VAPATTPDLAELAARLAAQEARLAALEDERGVLDNLYRYGHAIDYGLEEQWLDCFTEDGCFDLRPVGPLAGERARNRHARGREALATFIAGHSRAPDAYHKHLVIEPRVRLDGDSATVASYFARIDRRTPEPFIFAFVRYHDDLLRCADGRWRFTLRSVEVEAGSVPRPDAAAPTTPPRSPRAQ
jgi:hypothetical protein